MFNNILQFDEEYGDIDTKVTKILEDITGKSQVCKILATFHSFFFFRNLFCGINVLILWSHWYPLFQTLVDSIHGF